MTDWTRRRARYLRAHPRLLLALIILVAVPIGWLAVAAAPPDPGVTQLPLAWQTAPAPVPNSGVNAQGQTLDQWTAGTNAQGETLEQWMLAGKDYRLWVVDPKTVKMADAFRPVEQRVFEAGGQLFVLRYLCFRNKVASGEVERAFLGGAADPMASMARTQRILPPVPIPSFTDGCAVKNHVTPIPADLNPKGVPAAVWTYSSKVNFLVAGLRRVPVMFTPVVVAIRSPGVPAAGAASSPAARP